MKRNKILIPTLFALAVTPVIALSSCNETKVEDQILDCVFKPVDLSATTKADFEKGYKEEMSFDEKRSELIFDCFGEFNEKKLDNNEVTIRDLWKKGEGAFKVNVAEYDVVSKENKYLATLRGYIAYVFGEQHTYKEGTQTFEMKANDFIMMTYQFKNIEVKIESKAFKFGSSVTGSVVGFKQLKYEGASKEVILPIDEIDTTSWAVKNSKNWI